MYILYTTSPGGSMEIELGLAISSHIADAIKRQAIRMMKLRNSSRHCVEHLENTPYDLCQGTNGFGDKFEMLYWFASPKEYTEMERFIQQPNYLTADCFPDICQAYETIGHALRFIVMDLDFGEDDNVQPVAPAKVKTTSEVVEAALQDAETLIKTSGPPNAIDRAHTAFHAYLKEICEEDPFTYTVKIDSTVMDLFSQLRQHHPKLQISDPVESKMVVDIMRGFGRAIEAINTVRNNKTLAHPNALLGPAEAMVAINAIRTMLHYLDSRLK